MVGKSRRLGKRVVFISLLITVLALAYQAWGIWNRFAQPVVTSEWAVGNIRTSGSTNRLHRPISSKEAATSRPRRHAQRRFPCASAPRYSTSPPPMTARRHTPPCVGRCLVRPLAYSSSSVPESGRYYVSCDWLGPGPRQAEIPSFWAYPRWPCRSSAS